MFWKGSLRVVIKTCNYKSILDIIKTIPDDDWKKDSEKRYGASSKFSEVTRALLLKYKSESYEKKDVKTMNKLKPYLDEIISEAKNFYGYKNLKLTRMLVTELPKGAVIPEHVDDGEMLTSHHRIHIPLRSDPAVKFTLDHKDYYLEPGHGYEINNQLLHEVKNESSIDRIHMIIDLKEWKNNWWSRKDLEWYEIDSQKY